MRPKSNQCHCQALEKVSLGRAMLLVRYNWILRGVSFILFALGSPVLPKIDFFLLNFLFCKISWKFQFSVKWLHPKAKFKKGDPLKIQFYLTDTISQPNDTFSRAWQWHWFDLGLIYTFCLLTGDLLPNFQIALAHSILKLKSFSIPPDKMTWSGEKHAQD